VSRPPADRYEAFLFDLDGVLYRGDAEVPGAARTVSALRERGRHVVFLTNNSARTPERVAEKLGGIGIPAPPEDVVTSAVATAAMLRGETATAFVIGEEGVRKALADAGIEVLDGRPDGADAVVVGWDRSVDYAALRTASVLVQRGAKLVATNADASYPAPGGELWPGAGALLAAVETTTGSRAEAAGKPARPLFDAAVERAGTREALVVGDRVETDILGAEAAGLDAAVVFSGAAGPATLLEHDVSPVAAMADVGGLLEPRPLVRARPPEGRWAAVRRLVEEAGLPAEGDPEEALATEEDGEVVGTASVAASGGDGYLHSVAVREDLRGLHLGTLIAARGVRRALELGACRVHLVTEDGASFFSRLGFAPIGREELPGWVAERCRACSESATTMVWPADSAAR
jgi:HAD superfamily hydrolase (TIGR01457 family)